jgi:hypothetical protein
MSFKEHILRTFTEIELSLFHWVYPFIDPALLRLKALITLLGKFLIKIKSLEGIGPNGPLRIAYIGLFRHLGYVSHLAFEVPPLVKEKRSIMLFQLPRAIALLRKDHDLIFVELPYLFLLKLSGDNGFTTMPWLHQILDLTKQREELEKVLKKKTIKRHTNKIAKNQISTKVSHDAKDLRVFYHELYNPYIRERHKMASIADIERLQLYFKKGCLLQVMCNGTFIYGALHYRRGTICRSVLIGMKNDIEKSLKKHIGTIGYYYEVMYALEQGFSALDFGLSRPLLNDGVFRFKKKWGAAVSCGLTNQGLWIGVGNNSGAATDFLSCYPFAWLDDKEQWHGLIVLPSQERCSEIVLANIRKEYATPGLESLFVVSAAGFSDDVQQPIINGPIPIVGKAVQIS